MATVAVKRVRRTREARRKDRTRRELAYLPPLERGIPYLDLMTADQVERVHDASMSLLENKGIEFRDDGRIVAIPRPWVKPHPPDQESSAAPTDLKSTPSERSLR